MIRHEQCTQVQNLRGGNGTLKIYHIQSPEQLKNAGRMYARIIFEPGSSVGWHQHVGETEPYYILKGTGTFIDNDGSKTEVGPGDICEIEDGQWHSLENNSDEDLEIMALIYNL